MNAESREHITCNRCGEAKSIGDFYLNKTRGQPRTTCKACCSRFRSPSSGKRTAEQRAAYRRRIGQTDVEYVPLDARRASAHKAHVIAWQSHEKQRALRDAKHAKAQIRSALHDAHVRRFKSNTVQWAHRYKTDPAFAIKQRLRTQLRKKAKLFPKIDDLMRGAILSDGKSPTIERICGYSIAELKQHLETQFSVDMNWDAFMRGEIHIDHIKPQRLFDLSTMEGARTCWALSNLQPLWAQENLRKGGQWEEG